MAPSPAASASTEQLRVADWAGGDSEHRRLAAVRALRLLDTPPEERFDRITRAAQHLLGVPVAMVTLVDRDRQWAKSAIGCSAQDVPRSSSFCSHAIAAQRLLEISDTAADQRFEQYPTAGGEPEVRFYAGQPIAAPSGLLVGTLCVMDWVPRQLTGRQRDELRDLAKWVELEFAVAPADQGDHQIERDRRDFVSVVSHELRTPLTSIRGSLELVASGRFGEIPAQANRLLTIAMRNTDRLARLAQDVVDLQQMQRGRTYLRLGEITVGDVVEQAVLAVGDVAERAGVPVHAQCRGLTRVRGDADRLVQVLTNLLVNAVQVSPRGEQVTITAKVGRRQAEFAVRDHGPGVPPGQLKQIFEPFVHFDLPDGCRTGGAGLGLAIARGIVDAHDGRISARPAAGGGSIFEVSVPVHGPQVDRPWW